MGGRAEVVNCDLRDFRGRYQLVISNPPYFPVTGGESGSPARNAQRLEKSASLDYVADAAARLLGDGGRFAFVYPAQRLSEAIAALTVRRLEPKRLRLVQARADARPSVFLMECVKSGKPGLTVEPALVLRNADGTDTDEARKIYHLGEE
jgi:tRNA1Val (adenine37-N6)-methyltransferase